MSLLPASSQDVRKKFCPPCSAARYQICLVHRCFLYYLGSLLPPIAHPLRSMLEAKADGAPHRQSRWVSIPKSCRKEISDSFFHANAFLASVYPVRSPSLCGIHKLLRIIPDISHAKVKGLFRLRRLQEIRMELRQYGFLPAGIRGFPQSGRTAQGSQLLQPIRRQL